MSFQSFAKDAAYQVYLEQINSVRNGLLNWGPVNGTKPSDIKNMLYFLEVKALSAGWVALSESHEKKVNSEVGNYYNDVANKGKVLQSSSIESQKIKNNEVKATYTEQDKHRVDLLTNSGPIPPTEIETGQTQFTPAHPGTKIKPPANVQKILDTNPAAEEKAKKFFLEHNVNTTEPSGLALNDELPKPGEPVKSHDGSYGQAIANSLKFVLPDGNGGTKTYFKSWATKDNRPDPATHGTPDEPFTDKLNEMLEQQRRMTPGSYKFFIEKLHGKTVDGKFFKKNEITPGQTRDQIPNRMVFPAYIMNFNDGYQMSWSDYKFIGRGEKVFVYEETTRSLALEFWMMSDFSADLLVKGIEDYQKLTVDPTASSRESKLDDTISNLSKTAHTPPANLFNASGAAFSPDKQPVNDDEKFKELTRIRPDWGEGTTPNSSYLRGDKTGFIQGQYSGTPEQFWARYTFLAQCCYAWFRKDGKMKEQPFVRIRIGDFFDVIAKIDSLQFTTDDFDMDLNPSVVGAIPMGTRVAMTLTIVHEDEPTSEYPRFYHRADFDGLNVNPYALPENIQEISKNLDSVLDKHEVKSPVSSISSLTDYGKGQTAFPNDQKAVLESLKSFSGSMTSLSDSASAFKDLKKIEKLKEALKAAKRISDISRLVDVGKIKDVKKHINVGDIPPLKNPTSLANTPIKDNFKSAETPKLTDVAEPVKSAFPLFKGKSS